MNKLQKFAVIFALMMGFFTVTPALALSGEDVGIKGGGICEALGMCNTSDPRVIAAKIIRAAMGLLGIIAVGIVLVGGFTWMTAGGNDEKVAEAKKWLYSGVIGLIIILGAFSITNYVVNGLLSATSDTSQPSI